MINDYCYFQSENIKAIGGKNENQRKNQGGFECAVVITSFLLSTSVHAATPVSQWLDGSYATGFCSYNSTDCSGTTGYIANRTKTVKVYAYASYGSHYFYYGSNSGSAYGSTVASAYVGVASP